ncbi:hypothetical protein F5Y17DRAFT_321533 [Xylariaceae sp. FL0594]|nr:hypothetical protein F5Y17DRAFT_321533 [Xylariaceae sp. FL0594]
MAFMAYLLAASSLHPTDWYNGKRASILSNSSVGPKCLLLPLRHALTLSTCAQADCSVVPGLACTGVTSCILCQTPADSFRDLKLRTYPLTASSTSTYIPYLPSTTKLHTSLSPSSSSIHPSLPPTSSFLLHASIKHGFTDPSPSFLSCLPTLFNFFICHCR